MRRPVDDLLDDLSWEELQTWAAFDSIEPIGGRRLDLLAAHWMQTFVNMHRDRKEHPQPYPLTDFILVSHLQGGHEKPTLETFNEEDGATIDPTLMHKFLSIAQPWPGDSGPH